MSNAVSNSTTLAISQARSADSAGGVALTPNEAARILAAAEGPVAQAEARAALQAEGFTEAELDTLMREAVPQVTQQDAAVLARAGHAVGDSVPGTIAAFQEAQGLPATGVMNGATRQALGAEESAAGTGPVANHNLNTEAHALHPVLAFFQMLLDVLTGLSFIDSAWLDGAPSDRERQALQQAGATMGQHEGFGAVYGTPPNEARLRQDLEAKLRQDDPELSPQQVSRRAELVAQAALRSASQRPAAQPHAGDGSRTNTATADSTPDATPGASQVDGPARPREPEPLPELPGETYTIQRGDVLAHVVRDHEAYADMDPAPTWRDVWAYNQFYGFTEIRNPNRIHAGDELFLPSPEELATFMAQRRDWDGIVSYGPRGEPSSLGVAELYKELTLATMTSIDGTQTVADAHRQREVQGAYAARIAEELGLPPELVHVDEFGVLQLDYERMTPEQLQSTTRAMESLIERHGWQALAPAVYLNHLNRVIDAHARANPGPDGQPHPERFMYDFATGTVVPHQPPAGAEIRRDPNGLVDHFYAGIPTDIERNLQAPRDMEPSQLWREVETLEERARHGFATPADTARLEALTQSARERNLQRPVPTVD